MYPILKKVGRFQRYIQKPLFEGETIQMKRTNNNLHRTLQRTLKIKQHENHIGNRNSMLIKQAIDVYFEVQCNMCYSKIKHYGHLWA